MEMNKEQLQSELQKANLVIQKLQQKVGNLVGSISLLEVENEAYLNYAMKLEKEAKDLKKTNDDDEETVKPEISS